MLIQLTERKVRRISEQVGRKTCRQTMGLRENELRCSKIKRHPECWRSCEYNTLVALQVSALSRLVAQEAQLASLSAKVSFSSSLRCGTVAQTLLVAPLMTFELPPTARQSPNPAILHQPYPYYITSILHSLLIVGHYRAISIFQFSLLSSPIYS